jgi:fructose-bisphosphate aldolase class 1
VAIESLRRSWFQATCERQLDGGAAANRLSRVESSVTFLKKVKGLEERADGVQSRKPLPELAGDSAG